MIPRRLQRETMSSILTLLYASSFLMGDFVSDSVAASAVEWMAVALLMVRRSDALEEAASDDDVRRPKPRAPCRVRNMASATLR